MLSVKPRMADKANYTRWLPHSGKNYGLPGVFLVFVSVVQQKGINWVEATDATRDRRGTGFTGPYMKHGLP